MVEKLKRVVAQKRTEDELTLNKIELMAQELAGGSRDKYIEIVNALTRNMILAIERKEVG